jgi:hypothetical protein
MTVFASVPVPVQIGRTPGHAPDEWDDDVIDLGIGIVDGREVWGMLDPYYPDAMTSWHYGCSYADPNRVIADGADRSWFYLNAGSMGHLAWRIRSADLAAAFVVLGWPGSAAAFLEHHAEAEAARIAEATASARAVVAELEAALWSVREHRADLDDTTRRLN